MGSGNRVRRLTRGPIEGDGILCFLVVVTIGTYLVIVIPKRVKYPNLTSNV